MPIHPHFARDFSDARTKFRNAAFGAGARLTAYQNPLRGPNGEKLFTDLAWVGPADAERVLLTISGTHGIEGFCGSGCQTAWFAEGLAKAMPPGVAHAAVHAINPHGFAWLRRVTEDNVDLNRNFGDHTQPYPRNPGYDQLADAFAPKEWTPEARAAAKARIDAYAQEHGEMGLLAALNRGQHDHPDGLFFGGQAPTWSNRTLRKILRENFTAAKHVAGLDFHTGLGPYGVGELITGLPPDSDGVQRLRRWFGDEITSPDLGSSSSPTLTGMNQTAMARELAHAAFACIAIEFGTYPNDQVRESLFADNWLHAHGDLRSEQAREIKQEIRRNFYPDKDDWRDLVWTRAQAVMARMLTGLAES
jgi:hypothetical protein